MESSLTGPGAFLSPVELKYNISEIREETHIDKNK